MIIKTNFDMYLSEEDIKEAIVHYILSKNPDIDGITHSDIKLTIKEKIFSLSPSLKEFDISANIKVTSDKVVN